MAASRKRVKSSQGKILLADLSCLFASWQLGNGHTIRNQSRSRTTRSTRSLIPLAVGFMEIKKLNKYRTRLTEMRQRLINEVQHMVDAIQQDANPASNTSGLPVHLADMAQEALDADVQVLDTERVLLDDIHAALARIDEGTFGVCQQCGKAISEARLDALPYVGVCIQCAQTMERP